MVIAWIAASLLVLGWVCLLVALCGGTNNLAYRMFLSSHPGAFVLGFFSCERLGSFSAGLAALTMTGFLAWASSLGAAG